MIYNFDEIIDRRATNSFNYEGWRSHLFPLEEDLQLPYSDEEFIRMWVADMEFSSPPPVLDAVRARLDKKILGYTQVYDKDYLNVLKRWFEKWYQWQIDTDELVTAPGIVEALYRLIPLLTTEEESLLICTPSYAPFYRAGIKNDRRVIFSPLRVTDGYYEMDFADMKAKIENPENKVRVFIFCHPHNPTGRVWKREELEQLGNICIENNVWLISDEVHCDLLRARERHIPMATVLPDYNRIITCTAASKSFNLAGNMLSHIMIRDVETRQLWKKKFNDYHSPLSVVGTQAAYEHGAEWLQQLNAYLDLNLQFLKSYLNEHLPLAKYRIPEATYLAWVDLSPYLSKRGNEPRWTTYFAKEAGVLIEGGEVFVADGEDYIRINVACPKATLEEGLRRMADVLNR
ncbi:MalY/PatB family protein [Sphingobacterium corticis]|uniref:cysteine-S-conjugate beta-lyase n=1 Tax=Sphingobacterium corticis TaxID=1812823 RepID=A0ABW5NP51_9SPHI